MPATHLDEARPAEASAVLARLDKAVHELLSTLEHNEWFVRTYWPENEARARRMILDVAARFPPDSGARLLDVGCFMGFLSFLFARMGYQVTAADMQPYEEWETLLHPAKVRTLVVNLNELDALAPLENGSLDVTIMGEVIEHVLNHPLGLMREVARLLLPGGLLLLTTPNPSTIMTAARVLLNRSVLWGTEAFLEEPKIVGARVISRADIHYREYTTHEVQHLLRSASFDLEEMHYLPMGSSRAQSWAKQAIKNAPLLRRLLSTRLLGTTQYLVARRASD